MKRILLTAAIAGASLAAATTAFAGEGYITANVSLRAGPDMGYPPVIGLRAGTPVLIEGCVDGWSWCDVSLGEDRGWVSGAYLQEEYGGRRVLVRDYGVRIGIPVVTFVFGDYWDHYYRGRSWYGHRDRYSHVQPHYYHGGSYGSSYGHSGGSYSGGSYAGAHESTYRDSHRVDSRSSQPAYSSGYRSGTTTTQSGTVTSQPSYQTRQSHSTTYETGPSHSVTQSREASSGARNQQVHVNNAPATQQSLNPPRSASGEQHSAAGQARAAEVHDRNNARAAQQNSNPPRSASGEQHSAAGQARAAEVHDRNIARVPRGHEPDKSGSDNGGGKDKNKNKGKEQD